MFSPYVIAQHVRLIDSSRERDEDPAFIHASFSYPVILDDGTNLTGNRVRITKGLFTDNLQRTMPLHASLTSTDVIVMYFQFHAGKLGGIFNRMSPSKGKACFIPLTFR